MVKVEESQYYFIPPAFKRYFEDVEKDSEIDRYLELIQSYYGEPKELIYIHFEEELYKLHSGLLTWNPKIPSDKAVLSLFQCIISIYIGGNDETLKLFNKIIKNDLPKMGNFFLDIYNVLDEVLNGDFNEVLNTDVNGVKLFSSKIVISRAYDDFWSHLLEENLKHPDRRKLDTESSTKNLDLDKLFSENRFVFINGHGDDTIGTGGLKYYIDGDNYLILSGPIIKHYIKDVEILGLLSCGIKPYLEFTNLSEYFILCDTSVTTFTEMFVKTFFITFKRTGNSLLSLKMGIVSLFLRSNSEFAFNVFHNGKLITL